MFTEEKESCIQMNLEKEQIHKQRPHDTVRWDGIFQMIAQNPEESAFTTALNEERARETLAFLKEQDLPDPDNEILDLGCGDGLSTAYFAACVKRVTALDFSQTRLEAAKKRIRDDGFTNVDFELCDIYTLNPKEKGWMQKFDLVFSSRTPPCYQYESIRKMETMSRKFCCLQMLISHDFVPGAEIINQVFGTNKNYFANHIRQFQLVQTFLRLEGSLPLVRYYRQNCVVPYTDEEEYLNLLLLRANIHDYTEKQRQELLALLRRKIENGILQTRQEGLEGWILWNVREKDKCLSEL